MGVHHNLQQLSIKEKADIILKRSHLRSYFYDLALKMFTVCDIRGIRLIVENPYSIQHFLVGNFPYKAAFVDHNRAARGDYFNKPTQYWFINCVPTSGQSFQNAKIHKKIANVKPSAYGGLCSEERSHISSDYARNFICDFILGKSQINTQTTLFD